MYDRRHRAYLSFIVGFFVCYFGSMLVPSFQPLIFWGGFAVLALVYGLSVSRERQRQEAIRRDGVDLEAEIVERYDAGVPSRAPANTPRPLKALDGSASKQAAGVLHRAPA